MNPSGPTLQVAQKAATTRQIPSNLKRNKKRNSFVPQTYKKMGASRKSIPFPQIDRSQNIGTRSGLAPSNPKTLLKK